MSELLLQTIVDKLISVSEELQQLKSNIPQVPDYKEQLETVNREIGEVKTGIAGLVQAMAFPVQTVHSMIQHLKEHSDLLRRPQKTEIQHHHHLKPEVLTSAVLFLLLSLSVVWLFNTYSRLDAYKANDTKYRLLKLQDDKRLHTLLYTTDSLYHLKGAFLRDSVIQQEKVLQRRLELLQKAAAREQESIRLRKEARRK